MWKRKGNVFVASIFQHVCLSAFSRISAVFLIPYKVPYRFSTVPWRYPVTESLISAHLYLHTRPSAFKYNYWSKRCKCNREREKEKDRKRARKVKKERESERKRERAYTVNLMLRAEEKVLSLKQFLPSISFKMPLHWSKLWKTTSDREANDCD